MEGKENIDVGPVLQVKKKGLLISLAEVVSSHFPDMRKKLRLADMGDNPVEFIAKVLKSTIFVSLGLIIVAYLFMLEPLQVNLRTNTGMFAAMIVAPLVLIPVVIFFYLMLYPDAAMMRRQKEMDYEIVFAGRHVVIALQSGMPLFDTFVGASSGYGAVSRELSGIVDKVALGMPMTQAIRETVQYNPSKYFTRMMMQIANALASGADVGGSLESVLDQISKEQVISLKEYSQKLTPIVMFYMIFGIIVPSLGIVLTTVIFSAISGGSIGFSSALLVLTFAVIAILQFLFLAFIESSRPRYLL